LKVNKLLVCSVLLFIGILVATWPKWRAHMPASWEVAPVDNVSTIDLAPDAQTAIIEYGKYMNKRRLARMNIQTGRVGSSMPFTAYTWPVSESSDGRYATFLNSTNVCVLELDKHKYVDTSFINDGATVRYSKFAGSNNLLTVVASNGYVHFIPQSTLTLWDIALKRILWRKQWLGGPGDLDVSRDGSTIAVGVGPIGIELIRIRDGASRYLRLPGQHDAVVQIRYSPDSKFITVATFRGIFYVVPASLQGHISSWRTNGLVDSLSYCARGSAVVAACWGSDTISFYQPASGRVISTEKISIDDTGKYQGFIDLAYSPIFDTLLVQNYAGVLFLKDSSRYVSAKIRKAAKK
jgi:hypothetical protein